MITAPEAQHTGSTARQATVFLIDDEEPMRNALRRLLASPRFAVEVFASASEFLARNVHSRPACILLDLNMPEMDGLQLQQELQARRVTIPVVFLTGAGSVGHAVTALQRGAADFIEKPFDDDELIERVSDAIETDRAAIERDSLAAPVRKRVETLTTREKQVLLLVTEGQCTKLIARELNISPRTVEGYRTRIAEKLEAKAVADLVRLVQQCEGMINIGGAQWCDVQDVF
jgi:two-component system, LuxR family, response regulator FixJ